MQIRRWVIGSMLLKYIEPIPLTEEILLKCGFEKGYIMYFIRICETRCYLRPSYRGGYYYGICPYIELRDCKTIQYLHQLQNLYFALTGKELEIKL